MLHGGHMGLASELRELTELFESGKLTEEEFQLAKSTLLEGEPRHPKPSHGQTEQRHTATKPREDWHQSARPLKTIVSVFVCLAASAAIVFATLIPFKYVLLECGTPIAEAFRPAETNPDYRPGYVPPPTSSPQGKYSFLFEPDYESPTEPNPCSSPARKRLVMPGAVLASSIGVLVWLWKPRGKEDEHG